MILAKKNGWLIAVQVLHESALGALVRTMDTHREIFVSAHDTREKLFASVKDATAFAGG